MTVFKTLNTRYTARKMPVRDKTYGLFVLQDR